MSPVQVLQISPVQVLQMSPVQVLQISPVQVLQISPVQVLQISPVQVLQIVLFRVQSRFYKLVQSRFYKSSPVQLLQHALPNDAHWLIQIPTTLIGYRKQKDTTLFIREFKIQNGVKESQCKSS